MSVGSIDRDAQGTTGLARPTYRGDDAIERHSAIASVGTIDSVDANERLIGVMRPSADVNEYRIATKRGMMIRPSAEQCRAE